VTGSKGRLRAAIAARSFRPLPVHATLLAERRPRYPLIIACFAYETSNKKHEKYDRESLKYARRTLRLRESIATAI
jgi:hypothetical protein